MCADMLSSGMQGVERQLRWHLVHWLCRQDSTYTELQSALPSQLASQHEAIDKVIDADHRFKHCSQCVGVYV